MDGLNLDLGQTPLGIESTEAHLQTCSSLLGERVTLLETTRVFLALCPPGCSAPLCPEIPSVFSISLSLFAKVSRGHLLLCYPENQICSPTLICAKDRHGRYLILPGDLLFKQELFLCPEG